MPNPAAPMVNLPLQSDIDFLAGRGTRAFSSSCSPPARVPAAFAAAFLRFRSSFFCFFSRTDLSCTREESMVVCILLPWRRCCSTLLPTSLDNAKLLHQPTRTTSAWAALENLLGNLHLCYLRVYQRHIQRQRHVNVVHLTLQFQPIPLLVEELRIGIPSEKRHMRNTKGTHEPRHNERCY